MFRAPYTDKKAKIEIRLKLKKVLTLLLIVPLRLGLVNSILKRTPSSWTNAHDWNNDKPYEGDLQTLN